MELRGRLEFCKKCTKRSFDIKTGVNCSLTGQKPTFLDKCSDYEEDETIALRMKQSAEIASRYTDEEKKSNKAAIWGALVFILILIKIIFRFMNHH